MRMSTMIAMSMLASCGTANGDDPATGRAPQGIADISSTDRDDRPLADRMVEANASDFDVAASSDVPASDEGTSMRSTAADADGASGDQRNARKDADATSDRAAASYGSCSDGKRVCGDMEDCADAVFHLEQCGMTRLDGDRDGTPCERICG